MNKYIQDWLDVIENMNNDNTYKLAWGIAILEIINSLEDIKETNIIHFKEIAKKMIEYYWNQTFFFDLTQGKNINKTPVLVQQVKELIESYKESTGNNEPIHFENTKINLDEKVHEDFLNKSVKTLQDNVCSRFKNCRRKVKELYVLNKDDFYISFTEDQVLALKNYNYVLSQLLCYKWNQLLEMYNTGSSTKDNHNKQQRRIDLVNYKNELLKEKESNQTSELPNNHLPIIQIIPWSFMHGDNV